MPSNPQLLRPQELVTILDRMREGVQILDPDWRYLYLNAAAAEHGRRRRDELLGRTLIECYPDIVGTDVFRLMSRCMSERIADSMRNEFTYPEGGHRTFDLRVQPCDVGIVVLSIDVTDELALEDRLRQAQRMEAVGRLAGGVAHDFNNLLSVILGYGTLVLQTMTPSDPRYADLEAIQNAGERGADLTRQLLAFSRQQPVRAGVVNVPERLNAARRMLDRLIGETIELEVLGAAAEARVRLDPGQLDQIVMNLALNARDAMPRGGRLTIESGVEALGQEEALRLGLSAGPHAVLRVRDQGVGMDAETIAHVFEPFFTTKAPGRGTGLGLSTVFGIVQRAGGAIDVASTPGAGTTFAVYLPTTGEDARTEDDGTPPGPLHGRETILLVEDQKPVRRVARDMLRHYGYRVLEAGSAQEALDLARAHPGEIDLLLADLVLPAMNGRELAGRFTDARPGARVLFMSGNADFAAAAGAGTGIECLEKPLVPESLARRVRAALDATPRN